MSVLRAPTLFIAVLGVFLAQNAVFAEEIPDAAPQDQTQEARPDRNDQMTRDLNAVQSTQSHRMNDMIAELDKTEAASKELAKPVVPQNPKEKMKAASKAFRERRDYETAFVLAEEVARENPKDRRAAELQRSVLHDFQEHPDEFDSQTPLTPPQGRVAYQDAMMDGVITLDEAEVIALKSNAKMLALKKRVDGARGKMSEARRAMFPTLSAQAIVNGGVVAGDAYTGEAWKLNVSQPIFYGGELLYTIKQAEANMKSDIAKFRKERLEILHALHEAYYGVVKADYNLSYQNDLAEEVTQMNERMAKANEEKLVSEVEYLEAASQYNQVKAQQETAINGYESADLLLHQRMGIDPEDPAPVDLRLDYEEIPLNFDEIRQAAQAESPDIEIRKQAVEASYYGLRVFHAKKLPRVDLRGSAGWSGEARVDHTSSPDIEKEHYIGIDTTVPFGPNTFSHNYQRRFFGPTVLSLTGSEDYKHTFEIGLLDRLSDLTDRDLAVATLLEAKEDLKNERMNVDITLKEHYYAYRQSLVGIQTTLSKLAYRETQVNILKALVEMQESNQSDLLEEMMALAEERFAYVKSVTDLYTALSNLNKTIGVDHYFPLKPNGNPKEKAAVTT